MVDPKRWAPEKRAARPAWEVYFFDEGGDHSYVAEMSAVSAEKVRHYLENLEAEGRVGSWSVTKAVPEMDYAGLMRDLRDYFG